MAIIPGIQICIPSESGRADVVLRSMEKLLHQRKCGAITRRAFLVAWNKKRIALRLTRDYKELQERVQREASGICESCRQRSGDHMHHLVPVAFEPRKALTRSNVKYVCVKCHPDEDAEARERVVALMNKRRSKLTSRSFQSGGPGSPARSQAGAESGGAKRPIGTPEVRN